MAFDFNTFAQTAGAGGTATQSLAGGFGVPPCMLELAESLLSLLPAPVLNAINEVLTAALEPIDRLVKAFIRKLRQLFGILITVDEDGNTVYIFKYFKYGLSPLALINTINKFLGALTEFIGDLYNAYQEIDAAIRQIKECLDSFKNSQKSNTGLEANLKQDLTEQDYTNYINNKLDRDLAIIKFADEEKTKILRQQVIISNILAARKLNPDLEPCLNPVAKQILDGLGFKFCDEIPKQKEIFRLAYGPPISREGKFILSVDGLYFDSQKDGLKPALLELKKRQSSIARGLRWKLEHDPSLGGKGKQLTSEDIKSYVNTVLDPNIIDDSQGIQQHYQKDEVLQNLIGQKNRRVFDVSAQINEAIGVESTAVVENLRQVMLSESAHSQQKINKRKKQIQLAKEFAQFKPGEVPVNDFSYLEGQNYLVDIETQKKLVLNQQEVSGVVLPIEIKYTKQIQTSHNVVFDHLLLNHVGLGDIVSDGSGVMAPQLSINNGLTTDSLLALYNLLNFKFSDTSSTEYLLNNSSDLADPLNAQIVAGDDRAVFSNGVGIAYLEGITKNSTTSPTEPSALGSYIKLPDVKEIQDLFYNKKGATFEAWVHIPDFSSGIFDDSTAGQNASSLYRLILANENTGLTGEQPETNILTFSRDNTSNTVKGLVFGFTRDRRFTLNEAPSNLTDDNPFQDTCLFLAPTQSYDSSTVGFINKPATNCTLYQTPDASNSWYGMTVPLSSVINNVTLSSCASSFCQITLTFNPVDNEIEMYCDGKQLAVSSYQDVFGIDPLTKVLSIPTIKKANSFEYNLANMYGTSVTELTSGPKLGRFFTPWIIGGGYTDGMPNGNFMGGQYGGVTSGLKGYIGGIKVYSKPLSQAEIINNYEACEVFFKNVEIVN